MLIHHRTLLTILCLPSVLIYLVGNQCFAQSETSDSTKFRKYDIFPAISYSPETKLTLGALGYRYFDFGKQDPTTTRSYLNFLALYTTANQVLTETNWDIFTDGNKMRFRGGLEFAKFPNRNYGIGNDAGARVTEYNINDGIILDSTITNYKRYSIMRVGFRPGVLWEITNHLYGGVIGEIEYVWNLKDLADSVNITEGVTSITTLENNTTGFRSGLGLNLVWDSRDFLINSSEGSYLNLSTMFYGNYLGSDYSYFSLFIDGRKYINLLADNTLALRAVYNYRETSNESLPLRGVSKVGGSEFIRGYFNGTFQNNSVFGFQAEYRIPFYNEDNLGPIYHYWKRLGMTIFASGAQVFGPNKSFNLNDFNYAAGLGLRILFNEESRANLRIDYAIGLAPNSGGPGKLQRGFYFTFGESF